MLSTARVHLTAVGFRPIITVVQDDMSESTVATLNIASAFSESAIPGAFKQIDFVTGKVLAEVQFGKYAFMFYDLAKLRYFFNENKCDVGIEIVPCHGLHHPMSSGVSYGEQLLYDIERLKRHFPAVPVKVMLIDVDD